MLGQQTLLGFEAARRCPKGQTLFESDLEDRHMGVTLGNARPNLVLDLGRDFDRVDGVTAFAGAKPRIF